MPVCLSPLIHFDEGKGGREEGSQVSQGVIVMDLRIEVGKTEVKQYFRVLGSYIYKGDPPVLPGSSVTRLSTLCYMHINSFRLRD